MPDPNHKLIGGKVPERPRCRQCGKGLKPNWWDVTRIEAKTGTPLAIGDNTALGKVVALRKYVGPRYGMNSQYVEYFTGGFGYRSCNKFCTQTCGFRYGLEAVRRKDKQQ